MSNSKRKTLGRGLSALLGDDAQSAAASAEDAILSGNQTIPIEFLHPGKYQPRHSMDKDAINDLAASIEAKGVLQPLLVRAHPDRAGEYEIIAGERRWRASQQAKLHEVPVIIKEFSDEEALEVGLVENLQREDLSPIEEADGYQRLVDEFYHTQDVMAKIVGKSRSHIANTMRLLSLSEDIRNMVDSGELSAGHARALIGVSNPIPVARKIMKDGLTVRQAEKLVSKTSEQTGTGKSAATSTTVKEKDADTLALERNMTALLGLQVDIASRSSGGVVTIHYKTLDQLDDVVHRLSNGPRGASSIPADAGDISFSNDMSELNEIFEENEAGRVDGMDALHEYTESIEDIIADTEPADIMAGLIADDDKGNQEEIDNDDNELIGVDENTDDNIRVSDLAETDTSINIDAAVMDNLEDMIADEPDKSDDTDEDETSK